MGSAEYVERRAGEFCAGASELLAEIGETGWAECFRPTPGCEKLQVVAPLGLGVLLVVVGFAVFFVPGIGILGGILIVVGVLLIGGAFAATRRRRDPAPPP
jgi:hypothetical protein